jgi:glycine hydroxymethyltransferase
MLIDVTSRGLIGKELAQALDRGGIVLNYNAVPFDPRKPFDPSGVRIGTPAVTTRGMGTDVMLRIAEWIDRVAKEPASEENLKRVANEVREVCAKYPAPGIRVG